MGVAHFRNAVPLTRLAFVLCLLAPVSAGAHEIGTTQVRMMVRQDHTWSASITTGPQSLLNKLEVETGRPRSSALAADKLRAALDAFRPVLAAYVDVRFDGVPSPSTISIAAFEEPSDVTLPSFAEFVATGSFPPSAQMVTWRYGLAYSTYSLQFSAKDGPPSTIWIEAGDVSPSLDVATGAPPPTRTGVIAQYLRLGFLHILPKGFDHVLFVLGIFLLTTKLRPMLLQVTAFTVAHSVTLGLTMYGLVSLPARIVEPLIAVSIAYVAIENVFTSTVQPWRPALVFAFGLLHGMGFAGVLRNLRLPRGEFVPALVSFNIGIEVAQLTVIAIAFLSVAVWCRQKWWYRTRIVIPASLAVAATGLFWTVQRLGAF
jgi:hypothetical protein